MFLRSFCRLLKDRLNMAENLLNKYRMAEMVITTRLHCILPCRAFNTESILIHTKYKPVIRNIKKRQGNFYV